MASNLSKAVSDMFKQAEGLYKKLKQFRFNKNYISAYDDFFDHRILASVEKEVMGNELKLTNILLEYDNIILELVTNRLESERRCRQDNSAVLTNSLRKTGLCSQLITFSGFMATYITIKNTYNLDTSNWVVIFILLWALLILKDFLGHFSVAKIDKLIFLIKQTLALKKKIKNTLPQNKV